MLQHRHLQCISKILETCQGRTLNDLMASKFNCELRPVGENERRIDHDIDGKSVAFLVDKNTYSRRRIIADGLDRIPMAILGVDQCSVNKAGQHFMDSVGVFCFSYWDKIHRLIRDIMKALKKCQNGKFLAAKIHPHHSD